VSHRGLSPGLAALAVALALPADALAHATLFSTSPGVLQRVEAAPAVVVLRFDQSVTALPESIVVRTATGKVVSGPARAVDNGRAITAKLRGRLPRGGYTVRWSALSADGHVGAGLFTFGVGVRAPSPSEAYGAAAPSLSDDLVRWALFGSLALLLGALSFRLIVLRGVEVSPRVHRRLLLLASIGVVATLESGIAGFVMRAEDALQLPFDRLLYGDLSPIAEGTRFGQAFIVMTLGYAAVAAVIFGAWLLDRPKLLWAAFVPALLLAGGLSLAGHSGVEPNSSWISQLADWVHLVAAAIWAGGLVAMALCVWPVAPELRRQAFLGFARVAPLLIAPLLAAGVYLSLLRLPDLSDLWEEPYGRVLLVKLGLVGVALAWGAAHHFLVRPRLEQGADGGGRLRRSLLGESAVGMAVLLAAAVLVNSAPPPRPPATPSQATGAGR
jgi:copper transport protein